MVIFNSLQVLQLSQLVLDFVFLVLTLMIIAAGL